MRAESLAGHVAVETPCHKIDGEHGLIWVTHRAYDGRDMCISFVVRTRSISRGMDGSWGVECETGLLMRDRQG